MTIEAYLAELRRHLRVGPLAKRRILHEVETHLRDAADRGGGERGAVAAFGSPETVAARFMPRRLPRSLALVAAATTAVGVAVTAFAVFGTASPQKRVVSVAGIHALNKAYDGTSSAKVDAHAASLEGVSAKDSVHLDVHRLRSRFSDTTVGAHRILVSGFRLVGPDAEKYVLRQPRVSATITARELTVTGITADNKVYDGTSSATLSVGSASLVGVVSGATVDVQITCPQPDSPPPVTITDEYGVGMEGVVTGNDCSP
jgi:hypothetical protein